jgi:hypothetical protein
MKRRTDITTNTGRTDEGCTPLSDATIQEMFLFLSNIVQMDYNQRDRLKSF